jgi:hypothetical protein
MEDNDPSLHRFTQPDTIIPEAGNPQAWNRYAYAFNNPILYNDPSGHCPFCIAVAVILFFTVFNCTADSTYHETSPEEDAVSALTWGLVSFGAEPLDWLYTAAQCASGNCDPTAFAIAAMPGFNNASYNALNDLDNLSDDVSEVKLLSTADKIIGKAQKTSDPSHEIFSLSIAAKYSKLPDSETVFLNKTLQTITGGAIPSRVRPDVAAAFSDGSFIILEIVSKSQTNASQEEKVNEIVNLFLNSGLHAVGEIIPK